MAKKIAEQLIDTLVESGVERIYAVTGDSLNEVNEAVRKNNKIQWIHVRHEETGAYAAAAEAQSKPKVPSKKSTSLFSSSISTFKLFLTISNNSFLNSFFSIIIIFSFNRFIYFVVTFTILLTALAHFHVYP